MYHTSIRCTPFEAFYGGAPPIHVPYVPGDSSIDAVDRRLLEGSFHYGLAAPAAARTTVDEGLYGQTADGPHL